MEPLIRDGDHVTVAPVDPSSCRPGTLLLALERKEELGSKDPAGRVCHRLLTRDGAHLVLGGDATRRRERHLPEDVLGRVVAVRRGQRRLGLDARPWRILGTFSTGLRHPRWRRPGELLAAVLAHAASHAWRLAPRVGDPESGTFDR